MYDNHRSFDYFFRKCDIVASENYQSSVWLNALKFWFKECNIVGTAYWPLARLVNTSADSLTDLNYTKFDGCNFLEEYDDLAPGIPAYSFGPTLKDTNGCDLSFQYLAAFGWSQRTYFLNTNFISNYRMDITRLSSDLVQVRPDLATSYNMNIMQGCNIINYGKNGCSCLLGLGSVEHTDFRTPTYTNVHNDIPINHGYSCPLSPYFIYYTPTTCKGTFYYSHAVFNDTTHSLQYTNLNVPNQVTQLFSCYPDDCPISVAYTFPDCSPEYRLASNNYRREEDIGIRAYPNPATSKLTIENLKPNQKLSIKNILGENVIQIACLNDRGEINIANLPVGIYFVQTEENSIFKFVKVAE